MDAQGTTGPQEVARRPLRTDDEIRDSVFNAAQSMERGPRVLSTGAARGLLESMRNHYEAKLDEYQGVYLYYIDLAHKTDERIAELEAQLAAANVTIMGLDKEDEG